MLFFWWQQLYQKKAKEDEVNNTTKNILKVDQIIAIILCCKHTLKGNQRKRMAILKNEVPSTE
jgi:ABC-type sugar transport system ATPase subunit